MIATNYIDSPAEVGYVVNGSEDPVLAAAISDPHSMRPYRLKGRNGAYRTVVNEDGSKRTILTNANATLLKQEWTVLDQTVIRAALPRLKAVADLRGRGLQLTIPNGMSKSVLQYQAQSDISPATMSMDGLAESAGDRPVYNLLGLPLPIIHKDFSFPSRQIAISRNGSMPVDLATAELAARRVAEGAEQLLIGVVPSYTYAGVSVYGYTNFPNRITKALTLPTGSNAATTLSEVLSMRQSAANNNYPGPYILYVSRQWSQYMDNDYILVGGNVATQTLRARLRAIEDIEDVVTLDYLNGYDMVLVQLTSDVVREVVGMDITTIQWETHGGMRLNFKVMCILVPNLRTDFNGAVGIVHGAVSGQTTKPTNAQYVQTYNP